MINPEHYDYRHPTLTADLVMKGGITSGVVYPLAACELAQTYRFRNVGGTSAGAIAAALTAAAECGRDSGGFAKLARLPEWLGNDGHLFGTFQPQRVTRRLFKVATAGIGKKHRITRVVGAAVRRYPMAAAAGAVPGLVATRLAASDGGGVRLAAPVAVALGGALGGVGGGLYWATTRGLPKNFFGLCTGMDGHRKSDQPALTPWLTQQLDDIAGREPADPPLTFGDLKRADVNLEMVTTSLSNGRPFRLPFREGRFFFDPDEMRRLFPERVVEWMVSCPGGMEADVEAGEEDVEYAELVRRLVRPLRPLPASQNLPVVVATRMSLSFPGLMSAVPLWAVDETRKDNRAAARAWKKWLKPRRGQWFDSDVDPRTLHDAPSERLEPEHCWFSDGGIVSNFPVHFFDRPLPRHPTFAINLRPFPPDKEKSSYERANVWIPPTQKAGTRDWWYPRWGTKGRQPLIGFGRAIADTMQNWSDNAQIRVPGYSDRVVHINHTKEEGGMNLNMPREDVAALAERGRWAGVLLAERFSRRHDDDKPSWDSHRWLRFRSSLALLEETLEKMGLSWRAEPPSVETSYPALLQRGLDDPPAIYRWADEEQRQQAMVETEQLLNVINSWDYDKDGVFGRGSPCPRPRLRIMPDW
jgi:predicted acylesterase/phospholipase RssA